MSGVAVVDNVDDAWQRLIGQEIRRTLLTTGIGVYLYDGLEHRFYMDAGCRQIFGIGDDEVFGTDTLARYIHPEDVETYRAGITAQMAGRGGDGSIDYRIVRADGSVRHISNRNHVLPGPDGAVIRITGVCIDVTAQREASEALRSTEVRMQHLADSVPGLYAWLDTSLVVRFLSSDYERLYGRRRHELVGQPLAQIIGAERMAARMPLYRQVLAGETVSYQETRRHEDGSEHFYTITYQPDFDERGRICGVISLAIDITERRTMERRLEQQARELARSNEDLEQFAYVASHDLKAPLRAVEVLVDWIREDLEGHDVGEVQQNLALLGQRTARLHRLLDDLLAYSRAGRKPGDVTEVDTRLLVEDIHTLLAPPETMQLIADPSLPVIHAHQAPLEQVLRNLVSNAIKHHPRPDGRIRVYAEDKGDHVLFSVEDDGAGIPPEFAERVFQMFQTLKPRDEVEGSGMGLAIVKRIVEWQGGRVWLHAGPDGRGTVFRFTWRKRANTAAGKAGKGDEDGHATDRTHLAG